MTALSKRMAVVVTLGFTTSTQAQEAFIWPADQTCAARRNADPQLATQVEQLLRRTLAREGEDLLPPGVGTARFIDLDGDGVNELLASIDYSGRAFYSHVNVIWKDADGLHRVARTSDSQLQDFAPRLLDLQPDGRKTLVLEQYIAGFGYEGAASPALETHLYQWHGGALVDVSQRFPDYYRQVVTPALEQLPDNASISGKESDPRADKILHARRVRAEQQAAGAP